MPYSFQRYVSPVSCLDLLYTQHTNSYLLYSVECRCNTSKAKRTIRFCGFTFQQRCPIGIGLTLRKVWESNPPQPAQRHLPPVLKTGASTGTHASPCAIIQHASVSAKFVAWPVHLHGAGDSHTMRRGFSRVYERVGLAYVDFAWQACRLAGVIVAGSPLYAAGCLPAGRASQAARRRRPRTPRGR